LLDVSLQNNVDDNSGKCHSLSYGQDVLRLLRSPKNHHLIHKFLSLVPEESQINPL